MGSKEEEQIGRVCFNKKDLLGELGHFGWVFKGKYDDRLDVAVKRVQKRVTQVEESSFFFNVNGHPNIVNYFSTEVDFEFTYIVTELCFGNLEDYVLGKYTGPIIGNSKVICRQIVTAIQHLHLLKIVHGDLKPSNILISTPKGALGPLIKVSDFGLRHAIRKNKSSSKEMLFLPAFTLGWMSPADTADEEGHFSTAFDIFPLALVFVFLSAKGLHPFGSDLDEAIERLRKNRPMTLILSQIDENIRSTAFMALLDRMLNYDASKRPTASEIFEHPALNKEPMIETQSKQMVHLENIIEPLQLTSTACSNSSGQIDKNSLSWVDETTHRLAEETLKQWKEKSMSMEDSVPTVEKSIFQQGIQTLPCSTGVQCKTEADNLSDASVYLSDDDYPPSHLDPLEKTNSPPSQSTEQNQFSEPTELMETADYMVSLDSPTSVLAPPVQNVSFSSNTADGSANKSPGLHSPCPVQERVINDGNFGGRNIKTLSNVSKKRRNRLPSLPPSNGWTHPDEMSTLLKDYLAPFGCIPDEESEENEPIDNLSDVTVSSISSYEDSDAESTTNICLSDIEFDSDLEKELINTGGRITKITYQREESRQTDESMQILIQQYETIVAPAADSISPVDQEQHKRSVYVVSEFSSVTSQYSSKDQQPLFNNSVESEVEDNCVSGSSSQLPGKCASPMEGPRAKRAKLKGSISSIASDSCQSDLSSQLETDQQPPKPQVVNTRPSRIKHRRSSAVKKPCKRYDDTDLYKPRPVITQSRRRSRRPEDP